MAYVEIEPTTDDSYTTAIDNIEDIRRLLKKIIERVWGVPKTDRIVQLLEPKIANIDLEAVENGAHPDLLIKISTSNEFQHKAQELRDEIIKEWKELFGDNLKAEIWIVFFHTWGATWEIPAAE